MASKPASNLSSVSAWPGSGYCRHALQERRALLSHSLTSPARVSHAIRRAMRMLDSRRQMCGAVQMDRAVLPALLHPLHPSPQIRMWTAEGTTVMNLNLLPHQITQTTAVIVVNLIVHQLVQRRQ